MERGSLVRCNCLTLQEMQAVDNGPIISVPFVDVGMSGSQVCGDETVTRVVKLQPDGDCAFIARHAPETRLRIRY